MIAVVFEDKLCAVGDSQDRVCNVCVCVCVRVLQKKPLASIIREVCDG